MIVENGNAYLYDSLQEAVTAVENGKGSNGDTPATITLLKGTDEKVTLKPDTKFNISAADDITNSATYETEDGYEVKTDGGNVSVALIAVTSVTLTPSTLELTVGGATGSLTATVAPETASQNVTWSSSDENVATVSNGIVTAVAEGTATITATAVDGEKTATCFVTVKPAAIPVTKITLSETSLSLRKGNTATLTATVEPENATDKTVTWTSRDENVVKVENGVVTAVGYGTATITVTTADDGKTASCTVIVPYPYIPPVTTYSVTAPSDAENGTVTVSPRSASRGTTVTITVTPDEGYELASLTVTDAKGNELALTDKGDGKFTFTMPASKVTVSAAFAEIEPEPAPPCDGGANCPSHVFTDVDTSLWYHEAVDFVVTQGMMNGYAGKFTPNATLDRGMMAQLLYNLEGRPDAGDASYSDVAADAWCADAVAWATANGLAGGYPDGRYGPSDPIRREQLAVYLYRYAAYKGYDVSARSDLSSYRDGGKVSLWAQEEMEWAVAMGLINGYDGELNPTGTAKRCEVAQILLNFFENVVGD